MFVMLFPICAFANTQTRVQMGFLINNKLNIGEKYEYKMGMPEST
jgi:hypothetical protein